MKSFVQGMPRAEVEDPSQGFTTMYKWQYAWLKAIAAYWRLAGSQDPAEKAEAETFFSDTEGFIAKYCPEFNLELPETLDVQAIKVDPTHLEGDRSVPGLINAMAMQGQKTKMVLPVPPLPARPEDGPVELANYAASGRSFPFTCCW